jgi:hypothetical protein
MIIAHNSSLNQVKAFPPGFCHFLQFIFQGIRRKSIIAFDREEIAVNNGTCETTTSRYNSFAEDQGIFKILRRRATGQSNVYSLGPVFTAARVGSIKEQYELLCQVFPLAKEFLSLFVTKSLHNFSEKTNAYKSLFKTNKTLSNCVMSQELITKYLFNLSITTKWGKTTKDDPPASYKEQLRSNHVRSVEERASKYDFRGQDNYYQEVGADDDYT